MNLPLYSPTAPGAGRKPGKADRPSPSTPTDRRTIDEVRWPLRRERDGRRSGVQEGPAVGVGALGGALPLRFARQPGAGPAGEGVRLVVTDVLQPRGGVQRREAVESELARPVAAFVASPVKRRLDRVLPPPAPTVRQPQVRCGVAAVVDEGAPFAVGRQAIGERVRRQPDRMAGPLAVERARLLSRTMK